MLVWNALVLAPIHALGHLGLLTRTALAVLLFSMLQAYLFPSDAWDGIWYHELTIGYAIQHHGYRAIDLPPALIQQANGYPRNVEMTALWFVFFTDRRLVDVVNAVLA